MVTRMPLVPARKLTPIQFLDVLFKYKYMIVVLGIVSAFATLIVSLIIPREFEANATLMVNIGREYVYRPEIGDPTYGGNRSYRLIEMVNSEIQILNSRDVKQKVISTIGIENIYPKMLAEDNPLEMATREFAKKLSIKSILDSNIIQLYFRHPDPLIAAKALNTLIDVFNQKHLQVYENSLMPFMEDQLNTSEQQLKAAEEELEHFKQKYGVYDIDQQTTLLLTQRSELEKTLNGVENEIKELEQKIVTLQTQMNNLPTNVPMYTETTTDTVVDESRTRLMELQLEEKKLLGKYTENSRLVQDIRQEISSVKNLLASQARANTGMTRTGKNPILESLELDSIQAKAKQQSLLAKRDVVKQQIETLNMKLKDIDTKQNELRELERKVSVFSKTYNTYLEKVQEARSEDTLDRLKNTSIRVIEAAAVPIKALGLSVKKKMALGLLLGVLSGIGLAVIAQFNQRQLSNAYAIEQRLQLPVLTVIPEKE